MNEKVKILNSNEDVVKTQEKSELNNRRKLPRKTLLRLEENHIFILYRKAIYIHSHKNGIEIKELREKMADSRNMKLRIDRIQERNERKR